MPKGWRTADILPFASEYEEVDGRMKDTGEWKFAIPQSIMDTWSAVKLPGEVMRGETDPTTDEGFARTMGLAGFGVTPFGRLSKVPSAPLAATTEAIAEAAPKGPRLPGVLSSLPVGPAATAPTGPVGPVRTNLFPQGPSPSMYIPESGFFMGPWANPDNMPGVTLASRPQNVADMVHATSRPAQFDLPSIGSPEDAALHATPDPSLSDIYSHAPRMDVFDERSFDTDSGPMAAPRSYPLVVNPGTNPTDIGYLQQMLWPWRKEPENSAFGMFNYPYGDPMNEFELRQGLQAGYLDKSYYDAMVARNQGKSYEQYMAENKYTSMPYEHEQTYFEGEGHPAIALHDSGSYVGALSPEGVLAKRWNKSQPLDLSKVARADERVMQDRASEATWAQDKPTIAYFKGMLKRQGATDEQVNNIMDEFPNPWDEEKPVSRGEAAFKQWEAEQPNSNPEQASLEEALEIFKKMSAMMKEGK